MVKTRKTCRICGGPLKKMFDLGSYPIIGYDDSMKRKVPLSLCRCDIDQNENACGLVQLQHSVSPYLMYEQYFYVSGINESMVKHLQEVADMAIGRSKVTSDDTIVDIGCNDGSSLRHYDSLGFTNLHGVDPARNLPNKLNRPNINIVQDYFNAKSVERIIKHRGKKAKLITSIAMFYDLEDPNEFVETICSLLDKDGLWILEMAYLPAILKLNTFDTICHEHLEYYSLSTLENLINCHGLEVVDVFENDVNGGSFQIHVAWSGKSIGEEPYQRIRQMKINEFELKLDTDEPYDEFIGRVKSNGEQLRSFLLKEKSKGKKIYAYGASTKGFTILGYYNIDNSIIEACSDRNEMKWGSIMRGSNIPIVSEEEARKAKPDYFLVLPWHFIDGFIKREKEFLEGGGKFVVPMPEFKVIGNG